MTKKHKQHYVWRHYLKAWSTKNLIWCQRDGKVFNSNLMGIGQSRDFYKLQEPSEDDLLWIKKICNEATDHLLVNLNLGWIDFFIRYSK